MTTRLHIQAWVALLSSACAFAQPSFIAHLPGPGMDGVTDVAVMLDGSVVVVGGFSETMDLDPGPGTSIISVPPSTTGGFMARYDATGALLWGAAVTSTDLVSASEVAVDENGHIHVVGRFGGTMDADPGPGVSDLTSIDDWDVYWLRLDANGNLLWVGQIGGVGRQFPYQLETDGNGSVYLSGQNFDTMDADPGTGISSLSSGTWIGRYDLTGAIVWVHRLPALELYFGVDANSGRVIVGGGAEVITPGTYDFDPGPGTLDPLEGGLVAADVMAFLAFEANGDLAAHHFVRGNDTDFGYWDNRPRRLATDANGDVYACGVFISDFSDYPGNSVTLDASSTFTDGFLLKFSADLELIWEKRFGAAISHDGCTDVIVDDQGRVWVGGSYGDGSELNSEGPSIIVSSTAGTTDSFIAAFALDGTYLWHGAYGGDHPLADGAPHLGYHAEQLCFGSFFRSTGDLDVTGGVATYTSAGFNDAFLSCIDVTGLPTAVGVVEPMVKLPLVYPNPATDRTTIQWPSMLLVTQIKVFDTTGQIIHDHSPSGERDRMLIDVGAWTPGLYHVALDHTHGRLTGRLVVE